MGRTQRMERTSTAVGRPDRRTRGAGPGVTAAAPARAAERVGAALRAALAPARRSLLRARRSSPARALALLDDRQRNERRYRLVFEHAPVPMALLDERLRIVEVNDELTAVLGRPPGDLRGLTVSDLAAPPHPPRLALLAQKAARGEGPVVVKHRYLRPDGSEGWARTAIRRIETPAAVSLVCVVEDFTHDQLALDEQRREAEQDALTGLLNRRGGDRRLRQALERMAESGPVAVILCDADRLKQVNDHYGHAAGDELLAGMAARLRSAVRATDEVARMGGDEFIIVARVADDAEAAAVADRCVRTASGPFRIQAGGAGTERMTLSAGVAVAYPGGPVEPQSLLRSADRALYAAKAEGGGRWRMAGPGL